MNVDIYDRNALTVFIQSVLLGLDGCSLDNPEDRDIAANVLVEMLTEYFQRPSALNRKTPH